MEFLLGLLHYYINNLFHIQIFRNHSAAGASEIMEAIINQVHGFLKPSKPEDDLTLVVVKVP